MDYEQEAIALYALPPAQFTTARDVRIAELKGEKRAALAGRLKLLRRPTVAAWCVNLLVGEYRGEVQALVDLGEQLADAQRRGDAGAIRSLSAEKRRRVAALVEMAARLAARSAPPRAEWVGLEPGVVADLEATLNAAVADSAVARRVLSGRLVRGESYVGFGPLPEEVPSAGRSSTRRSSTAESSAGALSTGGPATAAPSTGGAATAAPSTGGPATAAGSTGGPATAAPSTRGASAGASPTGGVGASSTGLAAAGALSAGRPATTSSTDPDADRHGRKLAAAAAAHAVAEQAVAVARAERDGARRRRDVARHARDEAAAVLAEAEGRLADAERALAGSERTLERADHHRAETAARLDALTAGDGPSARRTSRSAARST